MPLTFFGRKRAESAIVDAIAKRLRLEQYLAKYPQIREIEIKSPIVIVAPYRSATTFLHGLLALDPDHRCPRIWEALHPPPQEPVLRGESRYFDRDPRVDQIEKFLANFARRHPELARLHPINPRSAEECYGLLETSLSSHTFLFHGAVTRYVTYLDERSEADWTAAYRVYRDQIKLLHWWFPGKRWALKSPVHLWNLDALLAVFPDALVVQIHRNPIDCMTSFCALLDETYRAIANEPDKHLTGAIASTFMRGAMARCADARRTLTEARFVDVTFERLVDRPIDVVREIYAAAGAALAPETEARICARLSDAPRGSGARQPRSLGEFGLEEASVERDFSPYAAFAPAQ